MILNKKRHPDHLDEMGHRDAGPDPSMDAEEERIEALAVSLEQQLLTIHPNGPIENDEGGLSGLTEPQLLEVIRQEFSYPEDVKYFRVAFSRAVERWMACSSSSSIPTKASGNTGQASFSLLDQLMAGGGGFQPPVSLEDIQEAASAEERLGIFEKMTYLEDLQMDWNQICPILCNDMTMTDVSSSQDEQQALQLVKLHCRWFDQGRSSGEYTPLLYGLCQNLMEALIAMTVNVDAKSNSGQPKFASLGSALVQTWRDMWLDLMLRGQYMDELAQKMEVGILLLLSDTTSSIACHTQHVLALVDPCARWFRSWTDHFSFQSRLVLLLQQTNVLPVLWTQIQEISRENCKPSGTAEYAIQVHALSILSIILGRTRLLHFPWGALTEGTQDGSANLHDWKKVSMRLEKEGRAPDADGSKRTATEPPLIDMTMAPMLSAVKLTKNPQWEQVLLHGLEAILWGCKAKNLDFDRRYAAVTSILQSKAKHGDVIALRFTRYQLSELARR